MTTPKSPQNSELSSRDGKTSSRSSTTKKRSPVKKTSSRSSSTAKPSKDDQLQDPGTVDPKLTPAGKSDAGRKKMINANTRGGVRIHPWEKIRKEYVEGFGSGSSRVYESQIEIAKRYVINVAVLRNRASREHWRQAREAYMLALASKRRSTRAKQLSDKSVEFDLDLFDEARVLLKIIHERFEEIVEEIPIRREMRKIELEKLQRGDKINKERMYTAVRADEIERLANALLRAKEIEAKAVGESDQILQLTGTVEHVSTQDQLGQNDPDRIALILKTMWEARLLEIKENKIVLLDREQFMTKRGKQDPNDQQPQITDGAEVITGEVVESGS